MEVMYAWNPNVHGRRMEMKIVPPYFTLAICSVLLLLGCASVPSTAENKDPVPNIKSPYSFSIPPYIHPEIIKDLSSWLSDTGDQVVAINLLDSQGSNRYAGQIDVEQVPEGFSIVSVAGNEESFGYQYLGEMTSGVHVLRTSQWSGGSGIFESLLFLVFERDEAFTVDWNNSSLSLNRERLLLRKLGAIPLGDRWAGALRVKDGNLFIGKDEGWFSGSGGNAADGSSGRDEDRTLKINLDR
jgi:hypothetical protein